MVVKQGQQFYFHPRPITETRSFDEYIKDYYNHNLFEVISVNIHITAIGALALIPNDINFRTEIFSKEEFSHYFNKRIIRNKN